MDFFNGIIISLIGLAIFVFVLMGILGIGHVHAVLLFIGLGLMIVGYYKELKGVK